ncbi:hypothetical protein ABNE99_19270 [Paenibacillus larvae]
MLNFCMVYGTLEEAEKVQRQLYDHYRSRSVWVEIIAWELGTPIGSRVSKIWTRDPHVYDRKDQR